MGVAALAILAITAVVNPISNERVAAATGAATVALVLVGALTFWQNIRLVRAAAEQAQVSHEQAVASRQLVEAATEQARASRELADVSRQQAIATETQAAATLALVDEAKTDRELEFRPFVTASIRDYGDHGGRPYVQIALSNVGRGPALNAAIAYHEFASEPPRHRWGSSDLVDLGPGESDVFMVYIDDQIKGQAFRRLADDLPGPAFAVGYQDLVGNKYRWAHAGGFRRSPDVWHKTEEPRLDWTAWT